MHPRGVLAGRRHARRPGGHGGVSLPRERVRPRHGRARRGPGGRSGAGVRRPRDRRVDRGAAAFRRGLVMAKELLPQAAVIYGASGDLTQRKLLPAFWHLWLQRRLPKGFALVGYARSAMTADEFRQSTYDHVRKFSKHPPEGEAWDEFARRLSYYRGEFSEPGAMNDFATHLEKIDAEFGTQGRRIFDAAVPPTAYADIVRRIGEAGLQRDAKIVLEKPFGRDLQSARELNEVIHSVFDETQVFRIDHYLGKETVQNILAFRFANGMFEPIWNRRYIDHVQITVAEKIGIEGRGAFYEQVGNIRDMISTHLFQVMTFVAMEPPVSFEPDRLRDEKVRVLRSMKPVEADHVVLGQYVGYRNEEGVAPASQTPTYAALKVEIDNWRWAGVPFFIRTGKRLERKVTEISLAFRSVPYNLLETDAEPPGKDALTFRVQPDEGISIHLNIKRPGPGLSLQRAALDFDYDEVGGPLLDAYE